MDPKKSIGTRAELDVLFIFSRSWPRSIWLSWEFYHFWLFSTTTVGSTRPSNWGTNANCHLGWPPKDTPYKGTIETRCPDSVPGLTNFSFFQRLTSFWWGNHIQYNIQLQVQACDWRRQWLPNYPPNHVNWPIGKAKVNLQPTTVWGQISSHQCCKYLF